MSSEIHTLHRYYLHSNRMKKLFEPAFWQNREILKKQPELVLASNVGTFMAYWYSSLFVVVEGWEELRLSDGQIDELLRSPNLKTLRLFRNGTFHFQKDYFSSKLVDFLSGDTPIWIHQLSEAFGRFFLEKLGA